MTTTLTLASADGPVYRTVSTAPPRDATATEVPVIDFAGLAGNFSAHRRLAEEVRQAATMHGFFYMLNHGIGADVIEKAQKQAHAFFTQSPEMKTRAAKWHSKWHNGYSPTASIQISPSESRDTKEGFMWRYQPEYDPDPKNPNEVPQAIRPWLRGEEFVWEQTAHLPGFKSDVLKYWQSCLALARHLVRIFALALDLEETYFDAITTYPGSDGVFNYYPALTPEEIAARPTDVGLGSHTDMQCFTLLWQDSVGGLQILSQNGEWLNVPPKPGTFVVNIGDFLGRLSNDQFASTVHRVYNWTTVDRLSMPFFFGFNYNEECSVVPTCTDANHPPKYKPITCGDWCALRFKLASAIKP